MLVAAFGSNCATKSALMAFDAFEKQVNLHHIVANRGNDMSGVEGGFVGATGFGAKLGGAAGKMAGVGVHVGPMGPIGPAGLSPGKMKKKIRERDNLDAPMKNQLQYYLRRHLDEEKDKENRAAVGGVVGIF